MNHDEEWDDEEIQEILSTFPETKNDERKLKAVEQLNRDIENGVLKVNRYGEINNSSARAYAKRTESFVYNQATYRHAAGLCMYMMDDYYYITNTFRVNQLLKDLKETRDRFNQLVRIYVKKEETKKRNLETEQYEKLHADRIDQGERVYAKMHNTEIRIVTGLDKNSYNTYYNPRQKHLVGSFYIEHNRYGEIEKDGKVLSLEAGKELEKALDDLSRELTDIIDIYHGRFTDILRKGMVNE